MIGLDTNVLVRYVLRDDVQQAEVVDKLIEKCIAERVLIVISLLTIQETEWVLRACAKIDKSSIIALFKALLESADILIETEDILEEALLHFENGNADFSDCLMVAQYQHMACDHMVTFDSKAAKMEGAILLT
ncbi:PilT domain-containing protein [Crenothrix polyspora]|uniref:PilT domain-containing protein n=1 Tax=Crenothrix polyspora TaxID=360316 RepID=A0A1R4GYQ7_9GAMM|nr:type II toxin-antitoxin system VapC family toxin [Crenothrix polyspora]SJM89124.1 PilT domain-containing protein [Crenothrix polyspora]